MILVRKISIYRGIALSIEKEVACLLRRNKNGKRRDL